MVQIEQRISRTRNWIQHLDIHELGENIAQSGSTHLASYPSVPATMRLSLNARPRSSEASGLQTFVHLALCRSIADQVADVAVDTVVRHQVAWAKMVGIVGERAGGDAGAAATAIAAKAVRCIEEYR